MTAIWLDVIGLSEGGIAGLSADDHQRIEQAELVIAPERVLGDVSALSENASATNSPKIMTWPQPFLDIIPLLERHRGKPVVILATGDPLWYGAASTLVRYFTPEEMQITPSVSGFQWAAARMGWPLHRADCLTVHGRPHETVLKHLAPSARLLILAHDHTTPDKIADLLQAAGYGDAQMTALGHIGGHAETRHGAIVKDWAKDWAKDGQIAGHDIPDFHVLAVACPDHISGFLPLTPGLPDAAFVSDGKLTKSETRAATLAALAPRDGGMLWDLGCGSGAVGIEWMRAARHARAIGIDSRQDRLEVAKGNAQRLGVPEWQGICATLPQGLDDLPEPDAVFIGGGLTAELVGHVRARLKPSGKLVVNTVTLESETLVLALWQKFGGDLKRIAISRAEPVGPFHGWRPLMPVTQWILESDR